MEEAWSNRFTGMNRDYGSPSVLMPQEMMAAANARHFKSRTAQRFDQIAACDPRATAHAAMLTR